MSTTRTWQLLWLVLVALFLYVGLRPSDTPPPPGQADLLAHAAINLVLGLVAAKAFPASRAFLYALLALLGVGGAIELLQTFSPNREPSLADFLADAAGLAVAYAVVRGLGRGGVS